MHKFALIALAACALAPSIATAQSDSVHSRFANPETITGDPTGLRFAPELRVAPRYPAAARGASIGATPVVAFVVDTLGRVELPTASFLNDTPPEFERAVCQMLPKLRFIPLEVGGVKQRVLFVEPITFQTLQLPDTDGYQAAKALAEKRQQHFATHPITEAIPYLEARSHCDRSRTGDT